MYVPYLIFHVSVISSRRQRIILCSDLRHDGTNLSALGTHKCSIQARNTFIALIQDLRIVRLTISSTE